MKQGWWIIKFSLKPNDNDLENISHLVKKGYSGGEMIQENDGKDTTRRTMSECYSCKHRRNIAGDAHISCAKPDPYMEGNEHGIIHGWFFYPFNFDPVWKTKLCDNYEEEKGKNG